jgi:hypothetical protein
MAQDTKTAQQVVTGAFKKSAQEQLEQLNVAMEEGAKLQAKWVEQSLKSVDDANEMVKAGIKYWTALQADARTMALEATKRAFEMVP